MNRQASTARTALNTSPKKAAEYEEVNCTIFPNQQWTNEATELTPEVDNPNRRSIALLRQDLRRETKNSGKGERLYKVDEDLKDNNPD